MLAGFSSPFLFFTSPHENQLRFSHFPLLAAKGAVEEISPGSDKNSVCPIWNNPIAHKHLYLTRFASFFCLITSSAYILHQRPLAIHAFSGQEESRGLLHFKRCLFDSVRTAKTPQEKFDPMRNFVKQTGVSASLSKQRNERSPWVSDTIKCYVSHLTPSEIHKRLFPLPNHPIRHFSSPIIRSKDSSQLSRIV
jgi:hypothetical protein